MKLKMCLVAGMVAAGLLPAFATDRLFTYVYEPETLPQGAMEFEQWVTWAGGRTAAVGEDKYSRWDLREELEYGVTDNYTVSLYLNTKSESYVDSADVQQSKFSFEGISLENKFLVLNPAEHAVGLSLYLEPTFSGTEAELEQKIILGQRHGDWKWALNLSHATEWEENFEETVGEFEVSLGIAHQFNSRWSLGLEARVKSEIVEYQHPENTVINVGPTLSYHTEKWWAALTVMPQVRGWNPDGDADNNRNLDLEHNERVQVRLLIGIDL
ncbi:MAG: hypothetical protein RLY20_1317 [Verrucomicrobiota bacterium]